MKHGNTDTNGAPSRSRSSRPNGIGRKPRQSIDEHITDLLILLETATNHDELRVLRVNLADLLEKRKMTEEKFRWYIFPFIIERRLKRETSSRWIRQAMKEIDGNDGPISFDPSDRWLAELFEAIVGKEGAVTYRRQGDWPHNGLYFTPASD